MSEKVKVVVVDDQNMARSFFELYIQSSTNYELVKALPSAEIAVEYVERHPVDLILMDVMMRYGMDGLTAAEKIKARHPEIRIILVTSMAESLWEERARKIGVESFWYKEFSETPLLEIMDRTMAGESIYPSDPLQIEFGMSTRAELSDRELAVLRELTCGLSNKEIAERLRISHHTVRGHIQNIMEKTGFSNRLDLAIHAKALGLVVSDSERMHNPHDI